MAIFFLIHLLVLGVNALYYYKKYGFSQNLAALLLIMFFMPLGGSLLFWQLQKSRAAADVFLSSSDQAGGDFSLPLPPDVGVEINVAPIAETLLIADYAHRRRTVLDLLKQDASAHVAYINMALKNEDTETAHYAASSILHQKRKLDSRLAELSASLEQNPADLAIAQEYEAALTQYLATIDLDPSDRSFYIKENTRVLEQIFALSDQIGIAALIRLVSLLLETGSYSRAQELCDFLENDYPESPEKYLALLESYYVMRDKAAFQKALTDFRNSNCVFDSQTISVIRLWLSHLDAAQPIAHRKEVF